MTEPLTITSNDTDEAAYEIYFTGTGVDTSECDIDIYQGVTPIPDGNQIQFILLRVKLVDDPVIAHAQSISIDALHAVMLKTTKVLA